MKGNDKFYHERSETSGKVGKKRMRNSEDVDQEDAGAYAINKQANSVGEQEISSVRTRKQ